MSCAKCKKKKPLTELPPVIEVDVYVPTVDDIKLAYAELSNMLGVNPNKRELINKVYSFLFNEEFDFDCRACVTTQGRKFHNYVVNELKINV